MSKIIHNHALPVIAHSAASPPSIEEKASHEIATKGPLICPMLFFDSAEEAEAAALQASKKETTRALITPMEFFSEESEIEPLSTSSNNEGLIDPMEPYSLRDTQGTSEVVNTEYTVVSDTSKTTEEGIHVCGHGVLAPSSVVSTQNVPLYDVSTAGVFGGMLEKYNRSHRKHLRNTADEKLTEYDLMCLAISRICFRIFRGEPYVYSYPAYSRLSDSQARGLIMEVCRAEIEARGSRSFLNGAYAFLLDEPSIQIPDDHFVDNLVAFQNTFLDINSGRLITPSPNHFITHTLNCQYDTSNTSCPVFDKFLQVVTGNDFGLMMRIYEIIGYILVPDTNGKVAFVFQGVTSSGKTLLSNLISSFFPRDMHSSLDVHQLNKDFAMSELEGKALCISADMPSEPLGSVAVSNIKKLSGNDQVSAPKKYSSNRQFRFKGTFLVVSNHPFKTKEQDDALMERLVAVPFIYSIPQEHRDSNLLNRLISERNAIATRAIHAYFELKQRNYRFSGEYLINTAPGLSGNTDPPEDTVVTMVSAFVRRYFVASEDSGVFTAEAHALFSSVYTTVPLEIFAKFFVHLITTIHGGKKTRKRQSGSANPTSYIDGVRLLLE